MALQQADVAARKMVERRRRVLRVRPAFQPEGVVQLVCGRCGQSEERVSYAQVPVALGCGHSGRVRIAGYDWERDVVDAG